MQLPVALCLGFILLGQFFIRQVYSQEYALGLESRIQTIFSDKSNSAVRVKASGVAKAGEKIKRILKMGSGFLLVKKAMF